jgi:guanine nucleotide-binding protein G(o) subunit alpha
VVYSNTIQSLVAILRAMPNLGVAFGSEDREASGSVSYSVSMRRCHPPDGSTSPKY